MRGTSNPTPEPAARARRPGPGRCAAMAMVGIFLAGCSGSSDPAPAASPSLTPSPTASTVTQEEALASQIPVDGDRLRPLRWRLPQHVPTDQTAPLLAARRMIALDQYIFSTAKPLLWANTVLTVEKISPEEFGSRKEELIDQPWEGRSSGPIWIWVMGLKKKDPDTVDITACIDGGWGAEVSKQDDKRAYGGVGADAVTVSRITDYPDGERWKVTRYDVYPDPEHKTGNQERCEAWAATHTTTEGWTLPTTPRP
ncbi:MAG: hypothetical protein QG608_2822 [Actinomycetota bacterium]|nr:hypothetical protein [Actinomycetota bacterium]